MTSAILYYFQWPWPWLGVTKSTESKPCWLHYLTHFITVLKFYMMLKQFKLNILRLLLSDIFGIKVDNCCFTDCIKKSCLHTLMNQFGSILVWWYILLNSAFWYWSVWLWLWFKMTAMQETWIQMAFGIPLSLVGLVNLTLISFSPFSIQERGSVLGDFILKQLLTLTCIHIFKDQFLSNIVWW